MRMNFGITAQGPQNDFGNALLQGMRLKGLKGEIDQRNALAAAMQQHGAGALSGDQNALNALAAVGPQGFQVASQSRAQHAAEALREREFAAQQADRQARLGLARQAGARAASEHAARMSALELQKEQAESLKQAAAAREAMQRGPEAWERWNDQFPEFENVAFDDAPMAISMIDGVVSELEKYKPQSAAGKLRADLNAGAITEDDFTRETQEDNGMTVFGPDGQPIMTTGPAKALTEGQSKNVVYTTRAEGALEALEPVADALTSPVGKASESIPGGNYIRSDEYQVAKNAGTEFLLAILRKDTGAAVTPSEEKMYGEVYLPQPGDSRAVLQQKEQARGRALRAMRAGMSPNEILATERGLAAEGPPQGDTPPSWMIQTNPATWSDDQLLEAERYWGIQ